MAAPHKRLHILQRCLVCSVMAWLSASVLAAPGAASDPTAASQSVVPAGVHSVATDMVTIMTLLHNHDAIRFVIRDIPGGARTLTTSMDAEIVQAIRLHAREMRARVQQGNNLRPNDPIFVELFRRHQEITDVITDIPGGVSEDETSLNPQMVLLIRAHARIVAKFVRQGLAGTHQNTPLPKAYHSDAIAGK